jgi:hypothetical protein
MPYLLLKTHVSDEYYDLTPIAIVDLDNLELLKTYRDKGIQILELGEPIPSYIQYFNTMAVFYDVDLFEYEFGDALDNGSAILLDDLPEGMKSLAPDSNRYIPVDALMIEICMNNPNEMFWTGCLGYSNIRIETDLFDLTRLDEYRHAGTIMGTQNDNASIQEGTEREIQD